MLVGGVVDDEVKEEPHAAVMEAVKQPVEVVHRAERVHDGAVVADVVAVVGVGRLVHRPEPDDVDAEPVQIVEALDHAGQVANAVAVRVLEAARVDFVDDAFFPPGTVGIWRVREEEHGVGDAGKGESGERGRITRRRPVRRGRRAAQQATRRSSDPAWKQERLVGKATSGLNYDTRPLMLNR